MPDPTAPALTTETAINPPPRQPGDAIRAALADRRDHLQRTRDEMDAALRRHHEASDYLTADLLDLDAQLAELDSVQTIDTTIDAPPPADRLTDAQLAALAADRGLTVLDVTQLRWYQDLAKRAGLLDGAAAAEDELSGAVFVRLSEQNLVVLASAPVYRYVFDVDLDAQAVCRIAAQAALDYLAGGVR